MRRIIRLTLLVGLGLMPGYLIWYPSTGAAKSMWVTCPNSMGYEQCEAITVQLEKAADAVLPNGVMVAFTGNRRSASGMQDNQLKAQAPFGQFPHGGGLAMRPRNAFHGAFNQGQAYGVGGGQQNWPYAGATGNYPSLPSGFTQQAYPPPAPWLPAPLGQAAQGYGQMPHMPASVYNQFLGAGQNGYQAYPAMPSPYQGTMQQNANAIHQQCQGRWTMQPEIQPNGTLGWVRVCQFIAPEAY